jgi:hypothetical protein
MFGLIGVRTNLFRQELLGIEAPNVVLGTLFLIVVFLSVKI